MSSYSVAIFVIVMTGLHSSQGFETSARAVALRYAIDHGLTLPEGKRAIILEPDFLQVHPTGPATSSAERSGDAQKIRQVVGDARVDVGAQLLRCVQVDCVPAKAEAVILVRDVQILEGRATVLVSVYLPTDDPAKYDGRRAMAIVQLAASGAGWGPVKFTRGPEVFPVRLPSK